MSKVGEDGDDDGKEEEEDMGCVFFGVKQENLHAPGVTIDYLSRTSFLLVRTTQRMFPLGLCQYIEDWYVFSLGPRCFSLAPYPPDAPTPVPLLLFVS